ncbi:hypothetical protein FDP41_006560 [Naegleria fowleri]|uniref:V-SNARE coiled-coil homology domain-containing protein n=1 Tax=Naegleria fowleri TaxID=5763 RepID=A0A6A5BK71_NAEFO|nr:uncharacterized protein FDP41_006560 [Naegleria fowleri]KAF0974528.1 hypothetical protein FDP41_006560 [Naegleria fowleri]CAG4712640.1 unnamed protein product [Naegleria fowleri]
MSKDHTSNESTPFLSRSSHHSSTTAINDVASDSSTNHHDIFVVALYSRSGPCLENNYNATPFNSPILSHGMVNSSPIMMNHSSSATILPSLGLSMESVKKTFLQVIEKQRINLNQFNSSNHGFMTMKVTYQLQNLNIHVLEHHYQDRFFFYVCLAHLNVPVRVCFGLLERCKNDMREQVLSKVQSSSFILHKEDASTRQVVSKILQTQLDFCLVKTNDKIVLVQSKIEDVKSIMISNIDKLISNMESTAELSQRTSDLSHDSQTFIYQARKTNHGMLCRVLIILGVLLFILIGIIVFIILMVKFA